MLRMELRLRLNETKRNYNITKDEKWIKIFYETYQQLKALDKH